MVIIGKIREFIRWEATGGVLLIISAGLALLVANIESTQALYQALLSMPMEFRVGPLELKKDFLLVVNDGLMAIFFLLVALEIKREICDGELSDPKQLFLPLGAALGGVLVPAGFYAAFTWADNVALHGWAIPAATDIAFSLGVLAILGSRVPISLKIFLTTIAVVDDLAAILIIAIFYTQKLSALALLFGAVGVIVLLLFNIFGVKRMAPFILVGVVIWLCVLKSGVHATLAGVIVGLMIPFSDKAVGGESPLKKLEHLLHPWVAFLILPLFAFANSGVSFSSVTSEHIFGPVTAGIFTGLVIGKPLGVFLSSMMIVRTGLAKLPEGCNVKSLFGLSCLTGIGFTMSLFIGTLAFESSGQSYAVMTRVGVFGGSLVAAVLGVVMLHLTLGRDEPELVLES